MGVDGVLRKFWRARYPQAWEVSDTSYRPGQAAVPTGDPSAEAAAVGQMTPIALFDYTNSIKVPPPKRTATWYDYFRDSILAPVLETFKNGAKVVNVSYERGSPPNKDREQLKRTRGIVPLTFDEVPPITGTGRIPRDRWRELVGNKRLTHEMMQYITHSFLDREGDVVKHNRGYVFKPPLGCKFYLHGAILDLPPRGSPVTRQEPVVYCVSHDLVQGPDGEQRMACTMNLCDPAMFPSERVGNVLEAEMACLLYSTYYPTDNCMIITPDGDLIPQLLLMARDRIDPQTGNFRNVHIVKMVGVGGGGNHNAEYIDINRLYIAMLEDDILRKAGVKDPVLSQCALCCLIKNDYIHGYAFGIKYYATNSDVKVPHVFRAFFRDPKRFAALFQSTPEVSGDVFARRQPLIDEELFNEFTEHVYISKYEKDAEKKFGDLPPIIASRAKPVREYLVQFRKNNKQHIMPQSTARVFGRQLLWVLEYWLNNYRGTGAFESPTIRYKDHSFYGWVCSAGIHMPAERVSVDRPSRRHTAASGSGPESRKRFRDTRSPSLDLPTQETKKRKTQQIA